MDVLQNSNKLAFVLNQLAMYGGQKKVSGDSTMIICPFHSERTPSGRIYHGSTSRSPGWFKCYGCGKSAPWDELATKIGLQPFKRGKPKEETSMDLLMERTADLMADNSGQPYREAKFKFMDIPPNKVWRTIPTNLLIEIGGRLCYKWNDEYQKWGTTKMLYFPVTLNGEQRGFFRARLRKDPTGEAPSYLNAGGPWSRTHGLWPYDYAIDMMVGLRSRTVVLVEGQRDALRLIVHGIPAMCIFGTQSWSATKAKMLEIAGVERLVTMFDGDDAGIAATELIIPEAQKLFETKALKLWSIKGSPYIPFKDEDEPSKAAKAAGVSLWDPGNCPEWILRKVRKLYFPTR